MPDFDWSTAADWDASASEENVVHETGADLPGDATVTLGYPARDVGGSALEHFYRLGGDSATTATDAMGVTDGAVTGATPDAPGINGGSSFLFDGVDDYISFAPPTIGGGITLLAWLYPLESLDSDVTKIVTGPFNQTQTQTAWELKSTGSGELQFGSYDGSAYGANTDASAIPAETWTHIGGRFNGSQWDVFVDGVNETTSRIGTQTTGPFPSTNGDRMMGAHWKEDGPDEHYYGRLQNVQLYSRALSDAEIQTLADAPLSGALTTADKQ